MVSRTAARTPLPHTPGARMTGAKTNSLKQSGDKVGPHGTKLVRSWNEVGTKLDPLTLIIALFKKGLSLEECALALLTFTATTDGQDYRS